MVQSTYTVSGTRTEIEAGLLIRSKIINTARDQYLSQRKGLLEQLNQLNHFVPSKSAR